MSDILNIEPKQAYQMIVEQKAILIDVRSTMEYDYVGNIPGSFLVPLSEPPDWSQNVDFLTMLREVVSPDVNKDKKLLFICRSGHRSYQGASLAKASGLTHEVYNVLHGFEGDLDQHHHRNSLNGWRFDGLPWMQT